MLTVKEWRKAKGFSVTKIAEALDVSPTTWAAWEDEPWKIPVGKMDRFCDIVGAELSQVKYRLEIQRNV